MVLDFLEEGLYDDEAEENDTTTLTNQDVYCCPICYTDTYGNATRETSRVKSNEEEDSESVEGVEQLGYSNPMDVISTKQDYINWCFHTLDDVKDHIRNGHGLDLSVIMESNDLIYRFQLRASDGLISRYLDCTGESSRSYWTPVVKRSFNKLASIISTIHCSESSSTRKYKTCLKTWRILTKPYLRSTNIDIIDDSSYTGDDLKPMPMLEVDLDEHKEENIIDCYRKMVPRGGASVGSSDNSQYSCDGTIVASSEKSYEDGDGTDNEDDGDGDVSIESAKDEWLEKKKAKPSAARRKLEFQRFLNQQSLDSLDVGDSSCIVPVTSPEKKRRRIDLDSDEEA